MRKVYYNEFDPFAAEWLRNLIKAGHIAQGDVDDRSIKEVSPVDLIGYDQCHFFAGIGVWSYALRLAGWPDDREVWTGSCPCQPFSAAGKRLGTDDERHLWPAWSALIRELRPVAVFGEQVASKDGLAWLDLVLSDLEGAGYAAGAVDLCAAGVGAPHIRQRLFFVAEPSSSRVRDSGRGSDAGAPRGSEGEVHQRQRLRDDTWDDGGSDSAVAHANGRNTSAEGLQRGREHGQQPQDGGAGGAVGHADDAGPQGRSLSGATGSRDGAGELAARTASASHEGAVEHAEGEQVGIPGRARQSRGSYWDACDWIPCIDGKARPVEPGTFPLAHGAPARVGRLRAYGNAIVAPVAAEVIRAWMRCRP